MRTILIILVSLILCGANASAQDLDAVRIEKDWNKIVNYVAGAYTKAWIEANKEQCQQPYKTYIDNIEPKYREVNLEFDAENFSKEIKEIWAGAYDGLTKPILELKGNTNHKNDIEYLLEIHYNAAKKTGSLKATKEEIRSFLQKNYGLNNTEHVSDNESTEIISKGSIGSILPFIITALVSILLSVAVVYILFRRYASDNKRRIREIKDMLERQESKLDRLKYPSDKESHQTKKEDAVEEQITENKQIPKSNTEPSSETSNSKVATENIDKNINEVRSITARVKRSGYLQENDTIKAVYTINIQNENTGTFTFSGNEKFAFNNIDAIFSGICDYSGNGSQCIKTEQPGKCELENGLWRVTKKAIVKFK